MHPIKLEYSYGFSWRICQEHSFCNTQHTSATNLRYLGFLGPEQRGTNVPSHLLKHVTSTIGDLLVCAAHLGGVDFSLAEFLLGEVKACLQSVMC